MNIRHLPTTTSLTLLTPLTPPDQPRTAPDIPTGWWHEIETPELTLSVNVFFPGSEAARLRPSMLGLMSDRYLKFIAARSGGGEHEVDLDGGSIT